MGCEKRHEQRFNVVVDARIRNGTGSAREVVVSNLSRRGCRITSPHRRFGENAFITITVARLGYLDARVKWRIGNEHGILFENPLHEAVLEHIRRSLSRESAYLDEGVGSEAA